jgi:hypothetical protein
LLRGRLARRGLVLPASGLVAVLAENASAAVPPALLAVTLRAAVSFAAGGAVSATAFSVHAFTLAKGAIRTMTTTRFVHGIVLLLAIGVALSGAALGIGAGWEALQASRGQDRQQPDQGNRLAEAVPPASDPSKVPPADFGPEVKGLRAKVSLARDKFDVGESIQVKYVVKNVSNQQQTVWHSGFWANHLILVHDAGGKEPPLTVIGQQRRRSFSPGGERSKNVPVMVPAGGEDSAYEQYDLAQFYDLSRPGLFTVQYIYEEKQGGWEGRLPSNKVAFEMVARQDNKVGKEDPTKAARVDGLEFVALAPDRVIKPAPGASCDFDLGLRVTNVSGKPLVLATFDVIHLRLFTAQGKEVGMEARRKDTPKRTPPVMLAPGASWTWQPQAKLSWTTDRATLELGGPDGRGVAGSWSFTTLKEGKCRLVIEYSNNIPRQGETALWVGKARNEVAFEIAVKQDQQTMSNAVRVADVDFQVVCDVKCQIPSQDRKEFVNLGFRLTNRGEKTLLFNLYDTVKLGLKTADGTPIKYEWVRLRTAIPRAVVLCKGETRTVSIEAQLRWRGETPVLQLGGTDPTGGFWHFDKLAAGKYLLHVEYENTEKTQADFIKFAKFQPEAGQVFWVDRATTADVAFEVIAPARGEK